MNLPANWKPLVSGIGAAIFAGLTILAALPSELGDISTIIDPDWKARVVTVGLFATFGLKIWNSMVQKSKEVTGGSVQQTLSGAKAAEGTQNLVDQTLIATKASGEPVTLEQQEVFNELPKDQIKP